MLPYHETPQFAQMLQILKLEYATSANALRGFVDVDLTATHASLRCKQSRKHCSRYHELILRQLCQSLLICYASSPAASSTL